MVLSSLKALLDGCWRCIVWFSFKLGAYCNLALLHPPNPYSTFLGTHTLISSSSPLICNHSGAPGQHHGLSWAILPLCSLPPNMGTFVWAMSFGYWVLLPPKIDFDLNLFYIVYRIMIMIWTGFLGNPVFSALQSRDLSLGSVFWLVPLLQEFCFRPKFIRFKYDLPSTKIPSVWTKYPSQFCVLWFPRILLFSIFGDKKHGNG